MEVHVFASLVDSETADVAESLEILPQWFPMAALPIEEMWADNAHWLPEMLSSAAENAEPIVEYYLYDSISTVKLKKRINVHLTS
jgi:hypothetical protein